MGVLALLHKHVFSSRANRGGTESDKPDMGPPVGNKQERQPQQQQQRRNSSGGGGGGRARSARAPPAAAAAAAPADAAKPDFKPPRGSRETAMLLRANGYAVLSEDKLRRQAQPPPADEGLATRQQHAQPAAAEQQQRQQQQQQPARRHVRIVEPAQQPRQARRLAEKRKHVSEPSSSEGEEERGAARSQHAARSQQLAQQPAPSQQQQQQGTSGGMKRVRSAWKMRPLLIDEKLAVFWEGRDDALARYDGGEFHQWLQDCEAGLADPADGFPYPLVVQDKELRTLLEIKPPEQQPAGELRPRLPAAAAAAARSGEGIMVPTVRTLPLAEQPDQLVREQEPPVVKRLVSDAHEAPDVAGTSAAAQAASAAWLSAERAVALDPPYIRYVQPTPDDVDLAVEYDLDEEDEEWLTQFNLEAKRAKSRKARRTLGEEWMEHLIDRMEKEYTAELQRHPSKWAVQAADPGARDQLPAVLLPAIEEVFPLEKCLQVPGINHYKNVIEAVYKYWKAKHQRAGRPLIQRLWYEPPWDRRKAARMASSAAGDEGGEGEEGPFHAQDSPVALAGIRKRRLDPEEAKSRFQEIRRDLESARTLADQVRKREKLKKRELQLYKEEWAARMQAIRDGAHHVVVQQGRVKDAPAQLSAVWRLEAAGVPGWAAPAVSGEPEEEPALAGAPQDAAAQAEERAARLAMRRFARDMAVGVQQPQRQRQQQQAGRRPVGRPRSSTGGPAATQRRVEQPAERSPALPAASPALQHTVEIRGPPPPAGVQRVPVCVWCRSSEGLMLGCSACPRCFCSQCFQRRPGLGPNQWTRAVRNGRYRCVICRGLEEEDAPSANTADGVPAADGGDTTSPTRQQQQLERHVTAARLAAEQQAERLGVEVPRGLGGAALRSFLVKRQRELEKEAEEEGEEEGAADSSSEEEEEQQQQQLAVRPGHRPARASAGTRLRRQHAGADGSSSEGEYGEDDEEGEQEQLQLRRKQRKLGGAALASHLRRLEHRRQQQGLTAAALQQQQQQRGDNSASDEEQPASSGGAGGGGAEEEGEEEWPHPHIPPPSRKLGGAALRSYIRRQEALLAEAAEEGVEGGSNDEGVTESEQAATSAEDGDAWPHPHIPPPSRKLGGAALRSYIKRQEALLGQAEAEAAGYAGVGPGSHAHQHHQHQPQRSGSSSGTAEKFGGSSDEVGSSSSGSEEEEHWVLKENRAPPAKRPRKGLGGGALPGSTLRKVAAPQAASRRAGGGTSGPARRGPSRETRR